MLNCVCVCMCGSGDLMGFPAQQNAPARSPHHPPPNLFRCACTNTHSFRIDPAASRRVIHQAVGHTQVCFTVGQCSTAHSRSRQPPSEGRGRGSRGGNRWENLTVTE